MLWRTSALGDFRLEATDGPIGAIRDSLFDDRDWTLRWFVVDTGTWLSGRKVLLAPGQVELKGGDPLDARLSASARSRSEPARPLDSDAPVSRHYEAEADRTLRLARLLGGHRPARPCRWPRRRRNGEREGHDDPDLRSTAEMTGYHLHARDGAIGHVDDFLLDPDGWVVRYIVVDTRDWWPGKQVLIVPRALAGINWGDRQSSST